MNTPIAAPDQERLVVMGQGYVGLPLALAAVDAGFDVTGYDPSQRRITALQAATSFIDDIPDGRLAAALDTGRFHPTTNETQLKGFKIAVISVPTPLREGVPDVSYIESAAQLLAPYLRPGACVILESTTYPGTTEGLLCPILEDGAGLSVESDFFLGYSPERIDPGNATWTFERTPKVISGVGPSSLAAVQSFFDRLVDVTVPVKDVRAAELTKLLENTFRHVNIALVNELAIFAHDLGIDIWQAIDAASTKPFGFLRFTPGPGVGGHCLPIDPSYLSWRVRRTLGESFRFVELANDINDKMPGYVAHRLMLALNKRCLPVSGRRILLFGLSYKPNTRDSRETPAAPLARHLLAMGAEVIGVDPHVNAPEFEPRIPVEPFAADLIRSADAAVVLADHQAFDLAMISNLSSFVLDTRHCLDSTHGNVEYL